MSTSSHTLIKESAISVISLISVQKDDASFNSPCITFSS